MKVRKTVIVDKSVWYELKKRAFENELTMSDYLSGVFSMVLEGGSLERAGYEHKRYIEGWGDPRDTVIDSDGKTQVVVEKDIETDEELREANERLLKKRQEIPNVIKAVSDIPDRYRPPEFSGGVPKRKGGK